MKRRTYLTTATTALVASAGCLGDDGAGGGNRADHPATASFEGAPVLGPDPGAAEALIVAFEDPSCSICASFHRSTLPELRDSPIGEGVAFVYRAYPIRPYAWGDPAAEAIVAAAGRSHDAATALVSHYYGNQSAFDEDNVLDRTAAFLDGETDVDGAAVTDDVAASAYADVVEATIEDGEAADASTTPTFFLFDGEEFVTEITGNQDADVFRNALGR